MQNRVEISIGKKRKVAFDELKAFCDISGVKVSKIVGNIVQGYIDDKKGKIQIVTPRESWDLSKYTKEDLLNLNTLIYGLNTKVAEELCHR